MMAKSRRAPLAALLAIGALALTAICAFNSAHWIGKSFPGFFVMSNRVIASVTLPHWPAANHDIFQRAVDAVNGVPAASGRDVYREAAAAPAGSVVTYSLRRNGRVEFFAARPLKFTARDYWMLFVPYLVSGLGLALIGIGVWYSKPDAAASLALLLGGLAGGVFAITGTDLYSPYWFFRIHILGEAFFPASLLTHLALVFPVDRVRSHRRVILSLPYVAAAMLGAAYEVCLYRPAAYTLVHNLCMDYAGIGGGALIGAVGWDYFTSDSQLVRQRIRVVMLGLLCGFALPGVLMFFSGITGGEVAVNYAGFTVILFPLAIGYAIVKHDLFEIDAMVKRSVYYLSITASLALAYLGFLGLVNLALRRSAFAASPVFPLAFTLIVVLLINPLKDLVQGAVDRVFFRVSYNPRQVLNSASAALTSTLRLEDVVGFIWNTIGATMGIRSGGIYLRTANGGEYLPVREGGGTDQISAAHPLVQRLARKRSGIFSRDELEQNSAAHEAREKIRRAFHSLGAELIVPLMLKEELIGFIALGAKESGAFFSADDSVFLRTLANQGALSIANASAYREIEQLNSVLENRVRERTAALSHSNEELHASLLRLEQAYRDLQRSQEDLSRAEKMATLGRLAAGIAHEMNTPLGASMTSLKLLQDLVDEYKASADDPKVTPGEHREIAGDMDRLVHATSEWLGKAAAHIRSLKLHTRALQTVESRSFPVLPVVEDVGLLLSHRLRLSRSKLSISCPSGDPILIGDPGKLAQVLTNLVANAIDANQAAGGSEIAIELHDSPEALEITVRDQGPGIAPEHAGRIFDEFFSTKPVGEGVGLGLPIARDIISNFFHGTISARSEAAGGTMFTVRIPHATDAAAMNAVR